jgi:hypothetical protein
MRDKIVWFWKKKQSLLGCCSFWMMSRCFVHDNFVTAKNKPINYEISTGNWFMKRTLLVVVFWNLDLLYFMKIGYASVLFWRSSRYFLRWKARNDRKILFMDLLRDFLIMKQPFVVAILMGGHVGFMVKPIFLFKRGLIFPL